MGGGLIDLVFVTLRARLSKHNHAPAGAADPDGRESVVKLSFSLETELG